MRRIFHWSVLQEDFVSISISLTQTSSLWALRREKSINVLELIQGSIKKPLTSINWLFTKSDGIITMNGFSSQLQLIGQLKSGIMRLRVDRLCHLDRELLLLMSFGHPIHPLFSLHQRSRNNMFMISRFKSTQKWQRGKVRHMQRPQTSHLTMLTLYWQ